MRARTWVEQGALAALWAIQPVTAGPAFGAALDPRSEAVRMTATLGLWAIWALTLVAVLVPRTITLTLLRIVAPAAVAAAAWATVTTDDPGWRQGLALASTVAAAVVALVPATGERFVNGSAYGPERRFPLRAPGLVALGLLEAVWLAVVAGVVAGPLLLAAAQWVAGALCTLVGWPLAVAGTRSLHRLAQRWLVFVPAGLALVDPLTLTDAVSMPARVIHSIGPARAETRAHDLTAGALGLAVQITFSQPQAIAPLVADGEHAGLVEVPDVIVTPTRPGAMLRAAAERHLPIV